MRQPESGWTTSRVGFAIDALLNREHADQIGRQGGALFVSGWVSARLARQKALAALRSEVLLLRGQLARMATLADHYHAAAEEQRTLVARRDRELASLRNNAPQRRRASIAERAPATQKNTRALTIVPLSEAEYA